MTSSPLSNRQLFLLALILVAVSGLAVRSSIRQTPAPALNEEQTAPSAIPDFSSARFPSGDALSGLGADWTFIRQTPLSNNVSALVGTSSTRESVIKTVKGDMQLLLEESTIVNAKQFAAALKAKGVSKMTIAGRDGYLVPAVNITGGTGFLLVGDSTTLLLQDVKSAAWPKELSQEVLSYIATVRVP